MPRHGRPAPWRYPNCHTGNPQPTDFRTGPLLVAVDVPGESTTIGPAASFSTTFQLQSLRVDPLDVARPNALLRVQSGRTYFVTVAAAPLAVRGREIATGEVQGHITSPGDLDGEWTLDECMWTLEKAELTNKDTYRVTLERDL